MEAAQAVLKVLEQHPAFKKLAGGAESDKASSESVLRSLRRNLLAVDGYSQLFFCDEEQKVKAINLKRLQKAEGKEDGPQYQTLRFKPQIDFQICELLFNERSNLLCAVGTHACAAIEISEHVRRELLNDKTKTDEVECKVFPIGDFFHSTNPSISVLRVLWHPFSHSHIAVLTSDNTLRLYDLSVNIDEPEQTLRLYALLPQAVGGASSNSSTYSPPFTAIDFCFGARDVMGWGRFAVYFLMEDGDIYALCPIVPYNCLLPAIVLSDLKATTTAKLKSVTESFRGDEDEENTKQLLYKRYQTQLKWLQAIKGRSVVGSLDEDYIDARNFDRKGRRKRKGIKEGEEAVEGEGGWVLTRQPTSVPAAPVLQGPIDPLDDFNEDGEQVCGLLSIPSTNPLVMARIYMSGVLEIFLSFDDLEAEWNRKDFFLAEESGSESALVLYERLDLNLPVFPLHQVLAGAASPAKKVSKEKRKGYYSDDTSDDEAEDDYLYGSEKQYLSALVPRLSVDPVAKDTLYVRHVAGVHAVKLRWFNRLQGFCANDSAEDPATSLPELQNSETELLLDTMPLKDAKRDLRRNIDPAESLIPGPSFGFEIVNEPLLGHFAIVLTSTFKCLPIRLRGQARGIAALPSFIGGEKEQEKEKEKETDTDKGKEKEKQDKEEKERQEAISKESFYAKIEPLLGKELPRVPLIATPNPSALSYSSPECLAFLIQSCHTLQSGYVLHIHRLNEEIANRVEMMENLKARQSADLSKIQAKVVEQKEHAAAQKRKLEGMKELQASLSNRAQLLLEMVQSQQPVLSTAEKKYHRELREKGAAMQGYKEKIEKLRLQTEKLIQEKNQQQDRRNLSERLVENLKPILAEEMALIGRTVEGVKNLKAEVDKEFPDA